MKTQVKTSRVVTEYTISAHKKNKTKQKKACGKIQAKWLHTWLPKGAYDGLSFLPVKYC